MKPGLKRGTQAEVQIEVTEDMCPAFDGVVVHRVYSTWSLAHHMEIAARKVLVPHLEEDEEGIGTHLSIDHISPTPVGKFVRVVAVACEVTKDKLVCNIEAFDGDRMIARGKQVQRVLPKTKLESLVNKYQ